MNNLKKKLDVFKKIIEGMGDEAKFYWLAVAVAHGDLNESEAGVLLN